MLSPKKTYYHLWIHIPLFLNPYSCNLRNFCFLVNTLLDGFPADDRTLFLISGLQKDLHLSLDLAYHPYQNCLSLVPIAVVKLYYFLCWGSCIYKKVQCVQEWPATPKNVKGARGLIVLNMYFYKKFTRDYGKIKSKKGPSYSSTVPHYIGL